MSSDDGIEPRSMSAGRRNGENTTTEPDDLFDDDVADKSDAAERSDRDDDEDLFGSDGEDAGIEKQRRLDDENLDSGDDEDRYDRAGDRMNYDEADGGYGETLNVMDLALGRAPEPETIDGELYTLAIPNFLTIESEDFNPETYVPPSFAAASTSLCWRFDPEDESKVQSNARFIRWSDGSLTLQLASNPTEQYRISSLPLAPSAASQKSGDYNSKLDSHTYLAAAAESSSVFCITSHVTNALSILPTNMVADDAEQRLQQAMAAARSKKNNAEGGITVFDVKVDPEQAKREAEAAEREKLRAARKRQMAADRDLDRGRRVGAYNRTGGAGLTIGGLEDDGMMTTKARGGPRKPRRAPNRRGEILSDDDDGYDRRGRTREDEYDEDDGFLVGSDEEPEIVEDDEDEEELEDDEDAEGEVDDDVAPARESRRDRSPKRAAEDEGSLDPRGGGAGSPPTRKKNRYIVDDDDDE